MSQKRRRRCLRRSVDALAQRSILGLFSSSINVAFATGFFQVLHEKWLRSIMLR